MQDDQNNMNYNESFLNSSTAQDKEIPVDQLSGDQGVDKTVMLTFRAQSKASLFSTSITVIKNIIGSAIISLPYTVSVMGWLLSLIMFIFFAISTQYTTYILLKVKNLSKHSTYNSIFYHLYRSKLCQFLLSFLNMFCNIGFSVAMLTVLKGALKKVLDQFIPSQSNQFYTSEWFVTIIVSIILLPTVLVNKIQKLRYLFIFGVFTLILAILCIFIIFFYQMSTRNWQNNFTMNAFPNDILATISVFPNIMFALNYQNNFFSIYKGLHNSTDKRMNMSSGYGVMFCIIIYLLVGLMGYCLFGHNDKYVKANFLLQLNKDSIRPILYIGVYVGFLISDLISIPPSIFVARNNLILIIKLGMEYKNNIIKNIKQNQKQNSNNYNDNDNDNDNDNNNNENDNKHKQKPQLKQQTQQQMGSFSNFISKEESKKSAKIRFYILTIFLYIIFVTITISITSLQAVFNIVGAIASCSLSFMMPFTFYVLLVKRKNKKKTINYVICLIGIIVTVPLLILSIVSLYI